MNGQFEQAQHLTSLWVELVAKMMAGGATIDPQQPPPDVARRLRDISLAAMGQQADKFLRSPQFLDWMKQTFDAQIAFRKQLNQFFTDAHHNVQSVAKQDVDALSLAVRQMETRVLDRVEALCDRLEQVSRRLDALESGEQRGDNNGHRAASVADASLNPGLE